MKTTKPRVLLAATECRDLAKVGGLGDVVRDLAQALKALGVPVSILMPCYDKLQRLGEPIASYPVQFGTKDDWLVKIFKHELDGIAVYLLRNETFFGGSYGEVYIDSDRLGHGPFEDDAQRFAFFSVAGLEFIHRHGDLRGLNVLHCHDWHTGVMLALLKHDARYRQLAGTLRSLFTIHNLDYQGTRPFEAAGDRELFSFAEWFPALYQDLKKQEALEPISDPHAPLPCFNPMRAGINLADDLSTVSPNYAAEITRPDDPARNFVGGRGLEGDLERRGSRLVGILNGLDYTLYNPARLAPPFDAGIAGWPGARRQHKLALLHHLPAYLQEMASRLGNGFKNRGGVLKKMAAFQPDGWQDRPLVVAVTRAARQKVSILLEMLDGNGPVFQEILRRDIYLIILGTGELEDQLEEINHRANGLFVCAFDAGLAGMLYAGGDIFLMPSDFEPCGLSQMIAMRYGCLPLVPDIGGLSNTVHDMQTGFVYRGESRQAACRALLARLDKALDCYAGDREKWADMQVQAMSARFEWTASAKKYIELYTRGE
jgi:starch synthase